MWSPLAVLCVVGLASAEYSWKPNTEYKYQVKGRTIAALHWGGNEFVGVVSHATLTLQTKSSDAVIAKISDAQYSSVQASLPGGWTSRIPEKELNFRSLPLSSKPFQIKFKNGVVDGLVVSKDLSNPELNLIKSVVSQLQVDTRGENEIKWPRGSQTPKRPSESVFRAMEDTVTGKCEVMYDISPLPWYAIQANPELTPMPEIRGDGRFYDIVKTKNFSNCDKRVAYHYGITGLTDWEPADNQMGYFLSRTGLSRVVISGTLNKYTVQSSVTWNKIILSPAMYNAQKGMVSSLMNVTLVSVRSSSGSPLSVPNPRYVKDLVYDYNDPFSSEHGSGTSSRSGSSTGFGKGSGKGSGKKATDYSSESNSSRENDSADSQSKSVESGSSSSDSSEEVNRLRRTTKRPRRSAPQKNKNASSGSSSSNSSESNNSSSESSSSGSNGSGSRSSSDEGSFSSGSSSSSSSSSEEHNPKPGLNRPPKIPLLPYFIGYQGSAITTSKDIDPVSAVKKLCSQISSELQDPSSIPQKATLSKFTMAARLIRTMDVNQILMVTSQIYTPLKSSVNSPWTVFRDAVASAGTGPCLLAAIDWIKTKMIYHEEAAEIVATISYTARTPTAQFMNKFFAMATSPEVINQPLLNTTALLSFASLARKAQVNKATSHNFFPVHAFGLLSAINPKAITDKYIPYMAKHLHSAVREGDCHKIQVYIRALGNLGHPKILSVFEPYLEGKELMSTFQRTLIVTSLNKLAKVYPQVARRVLFNLYQNLGEAHELRCASVILLMRTIPPAFMLQAMAEFTNIDNSLQVISVVQSAIRSAANLQGPPYDELKKNAQAALHLLNPIHLGLHYSHYFLKSYMIKKMALAYRQELSWIGSSDGFIPSSVFLSRSYNIGGWTSQNMVLSVMTSSFKDLVDAIGDQFEDSNSPSSSGGKDHGKSESRGKKSPGSSHESSHSPFTTEKIAEMLTITPADYDQVEGNVLVSHLDSRRFFTFDNTTIDNLPSMLKNAGNAIRSGYHYNYSKLYTRTAVTLAFPTETGMPFVYSLKTPTHISMRGELRGKTYPDIASGSGKKIRIPDVANASASLHLVWSTSMSTKISFVAPLTHQRYVAGLEKSIQINLPIKAHFDWDKKKGAASISIQPLYRSRDSQIFQYINTPYTAKHNILEMNPINLGSNFKIVHVQEPKTLESTVGRGTTGFAFRTKCTSEQKFLDVTSVLEKLHQHDAISIFIYPFAERSISYNSISITFDSQRSSSKTGKFSLSFDTNTDGSSSSSHDVNESGSDTNESHEQKSKSGSSSAETTGSTDVSIASPSTSTPVDNKRQQEFLRRASFGIRNGTATVLNFAAEFDGEQKVSYVATFTYASSVVDENTRTLFYFHRSPNEAQSKSYEVCAVAKGKWPKVPLMNFAKALRANPTSYVNSEFSFGEKCGSGASKISLSAKAEQTQERKDFIRSSLMGQKCMSQVQSGTYLEPACRNLTASANFLDSYSIDIQYDRLPAAFKNFTYKAYSLARYYAYPYLDENAVNVHNKEGSMSFEIDFEPDLKAVNVSLSAPYLDADFKYVRVNQWVRPLVVQHPTWSAKDRFLTTTYHGQWTSSCGLDRDSVSTFDHRTYPAHLGKCWHVMMIPQPEGSSDSSSSSSTSDPTDEVTVLARDYSSHQKEVKIILGDAVFDLKPAGSSSSKHSAESGGADGMVFFNQKQLSVSQRKVNQVTDSNGKTVAFWYTLPSGEVIFEAPQHYLAIMYNGESAWIEAGSTYRTKVMGLCGNYDSEPATDFTSPKNCILAEPKMFTASWAVPDQFCQGGAKEDQRRAASAPCYPQTITPHDVISEQDHKAGFSSFRSSNFPKWTNFHSGTNSGCIEYRTKVIQETNQTCFSTKPLPTCTTKCHATGKVEKSVPFHCVSKSAASRLLGDAIIIKKLNDLDFSHKELTKTMKVYVPKSCTPK